MPPNRPALAAVIPRQVRALLITRLVTAAAVVGQTTIVGMQVYEMTGSTLNLGLLGLAEFVPVALLSPVAGTLADRFDRRVVAGVGLLGEALCSLALALYALTDPTAVGPIFAIVVVFGAARAIVGPPLRALPVDIAPVGVVERVLAQMTLIMQLGFIVGPIVAGFLYVVDPSVPYFAASALFALGAVLLSAVPLVVVRRPMAVAGPIAVLRSAFEGLVFIRRTPVLFGAISLDLFAVLVGGAVALLPAIAEERLGVGSIGLGWLRAAAGIGAAGMSLVIAARPITRRIGPTLLAAVAVFGLATVVLGLTHSYVVAFVAVLVLNASDSISVFIRTAITPIATPEEMRGRVLAGEQVFIGASNELGSFRSGLAADWLGTVGAIVVGGVGTLVVVGLWWRLFPDLRRINRFDDIAPAPLPRE